MRLQTKRLILRSLRGSDQESLIANINNIRVSKWLLLVPYPYMQKNAHWWINHAQQETKKQPRTDYNFGIELKQAKSIIGGIGITHVDSYQGTAEVGYWLGVRYHRKGYGTEALRAILDFAFKNLKLRRIESGVFVGNTPSRKLLERFGFKKEGLTKEGRRCRADGKIKDEYKYGLLKRNYHPARKP